MSKRLQVLLDEEEFAEIQDLASQADLTVAEWVRRALRKARDEVAPRTPSQKLQAFRQAYRLEFPTGSVEQMDREIEAGCSSGLP